MRGEESVPVRVPRCVNAKGVCAKMTARAAVASDVANASAAVDASAGARSDEGPLLAIRHTQRVRQ